MKESLIKNTSAYISLIKDIKNDRLNHAYLLLSSDRLTREKFLLLATMAIMCPSRGCGYCAVCKKIKNNNHVDVKYIAANAKIKVKDANELVEDTQIKSIEGGRKVYIIENAEEMSAAVQNKLLKTYEEPPQNVVIILSAANDSTLLPTIKSRAKKLFILPFSSHDIIEELTESGLSKEKAEVIASYAQGSFEKAQAMAQREDYQQYFMSVMEILLTLKNSKQIIDYIYNPVFEKGNIALTLDFMEIILSDVLSIKTHADIPLKIKNRDYDLQRLADRFSPAAAAMALLSVNEARKMLNFNVNAVSVAEKILFDILEASYKWQ